MAFSDPYFAIKASLSGTISDLQKAKDEVVTPLIQTAMVKQQRQSRLVSSTPSLVVDTTDIKRHLDEFEEEFAKVQKGLKFCEGMLVAIRSGEAGGKTFQPVEVLARQRFVEQSVGDAGALQSFLSASRAVEADLASGVLVIKSKASGIVGSASSSPLGGSAVPPPGLNSSGGQMVVSTSSSTKEEREAREAAKAKAKAAAEEVHFNGNEAFIQAQRQIQREEHQLQEAALDRISARVGEIRSSVVNIGEEMSTQDTMLYEQLELTEQVRRKLAATTAKINHLMDNMSNRGKICTIVVLMMVLMFLIVLSF